MAAYGAEIDGNYKKTGALTADELRALCETVEMATGMNVVIMGTRTALRKVTGLQNATYISDAMKNEHYTTGMLGMWEGYELVEIEQGFKRNDMTQYLVANDILWIMPISEQKFIKFVNEGETQIYQVTDPAQHMDLTYDFEFQKKIGIALMFNVSFGMYVQVA